MDAQDSLDLETLDALVAMSEETDAWIKDQLRAQFGDSVVQHILDTGVTPPWLRLVRDFQPRWRLEYVALYAHDVKVAERTFRLPSPAHAQ